MPATNTPQEAATMMSRRRLLVEWFGGSVMASQRPDQHRRSLDQRHHVKQHHQHAERQRDRDRARAAAALLLLGEHDPVFGIFAHRPYPSRASAWSASSAANSTNT